MADFVQTMKDWRRMCNACQTEKDICGVCGCYPAGNYAVCAMKSMDKEADSACDNLYFERLEKTITAWAAEHPEPVYPTWAEYLNSIGVTISDRPFPAPNIPVCVYQASVKMFEPIHTDIAQKLGIKPKGEA